MTAGDDLLSQIASAEGIVKTLRAEAEPIREQLANLDSQIAKRSNEIAGLKKIMAERKKPVRVSDHAVMRYLERKHGFCFEEVREELLTPTVRQAIEIGAAGVKIPGGTLKISGKTITTFIGKDK